MVRTVHYVGMDYDTYLRARKVWGGPAYYHKWMDDRVWTEVGDKDTVVVGDHNYGEGSSREHAAMEPRHLGVKVVLVKSFARIHETNLKKQGMLGITFSNESDYDLIQEDDLFNFIDLESFSPGKQISIEIVHSDGSKDLIKADHTYNDQQIEWYKEGSALNLIKKAN